jgi:hypothetical protein
VLKSEKNDLYTKGTTMVEMIEITDLDLRYEKFRLKSKKREQALLASIIEYGIEDVLLGINLSNGIKILLDGFKRYRCAKKLNISIVPYSSLGDDEPLAMIKLIRASIAKPLTILEQAKMIDELQKIHYMSHHDIAALLQKSRAWVSLRSGIIREMSPFVTKQIFKGAFPVYSYMYTLKKFIRINTISKTQIDEFVKSVAGKGLSIRDIDFLAHGFFKGTDKIQQQIKYGNITWSIDQLKKEPQASLDTNNILKDLELVQRQMQALIHKVKDDNFNNTFYAQATLLIQGILDINKNFVIAMRDFYDRCEQA